jgi:hypothetical protein
MQSERSEQSIYIFVFWHRAEILSLRSRITMGGLRSLSMAQRGFNELKRGADELKIAKTYISQQTSLSAIWIQ